MNRAQPRNCDSGVLQKNIIVIVGNLRNKFCVAYSTRLLPLCTVQVVMRWDNIERSAALYPSAH